MPGTGEHLQATRGPGRETGGEMDDATLVAAARSDRQQFSAIYDRYVTPIYRYCYVRLGSREEAEDATSDVFLKSLARLHTYRGGNFAAWIYRIAHNAVVDRQRHRRPYLPMDSVETMADTPLSDQGAMDPTDQERVRRHVATLPDDQRASIELQLAGWPDSRISEALGKSVAAVKKLRFRAVRRLRRALAADEQRRT